MSSVACILSQFPRYDEAFILRELTELSRDGRELAIFSLRPCRDRVIHEQAKALQPRTVYAPFVWSASVWGSQLHFVRRNPRVYVGALGWVISRHWRHPLMLLKTLIFFPKTVHFARLMQQRGVTHVHAFWATYPASAAVIIERLTGIPFSMSGHAHDIHTANPALAEKMLHAKFVLTCTEANKAFLENLMNERARADVPTCIRTHVRTSARVNVIVNYHGVDVQRFAPVSKPEGDTCRILAVGSLLPCKGLETLIEACRQLRERAVPFRCTIAGGGPLDGALRRLIARHGLEQAVEITGFISQDDVATQYQQAHLFVLPLISKMHWGIPNVLIEALATKTPVITCALPSLRELVEHGRTGWVIPEQDPRALADAIAQLWANASVRASLAEAGYQRVLERFSLERTGERLRQIFIGGMSPRVWTSVARPHDASQRWTSPTAFLRGPVSDLIYYASRIANGRGDGLRILTYHRVTDAHPDDRLCVPVSRFQEQMRHLAAHGYRTMTFADAVRWVGRHGALPSRAVVLTFDDGFEDNFLHAYPTMQQHGFTGVFFVPSGFIEEGVNGHPVADRPMTWEQLQQLLQHGHEVGGHSVTHQKLAEIPSAKVSNEVRGCKASLESRLQRSVDFFCYPAGSYNAAVRQAVVEAGYHGACTVEPGANRQGADPFTLTRTEISAFDTLWDFEKKLAGAYDWMHLVVQMLGKGKSQK